MKNGSTNLHAFRADHLTPVRLSWAGAEKSGTGTPAKRVNKKSHHKKQRSWDKKLVRESLAGSG
jgi:hypothetical protein